MAVREVLTEASRAPTGLKGKMVDVVDIKKPPDTQYALHLAKVISKLSPLVGNMIEFAIVRELNELDWKGQGQWVRQDPGFPDTVFEGAIRPKPGIEVKTWLPLATEITARFRDSGGHFKADQTDVALIAWLPEHLLYGKPIVLDVWIDSAKSLAAARDQHYHNPPDYLVIEPEDTRTRTANLQQRNVNGYKFQGTNEQLRRAARQVENWGPRGRVYQSTPAYQARLRRLLGLYRYRLDTNFAKIDRIQHRGLEQFKARVLASEFYGCTVEEWASKITGDAQAIRSLLEG